MPLKCGGEFKSIHWVLTLVFFLGHREMRPSLSDLAYLGKRALTKPAPDIWETKRERKGKDTRDRSDYYSDTIVNNEIVTVPSWRVSIFIKQDHISRNSSKIGFHQGIQKFPSINWLHRITEACIAWTQGHLHIVESISHRIDCIYHKSHFGILNMMCSQSQRTCWEKKLRINFEVFCSSSL